MRSRYRCRARRWALYRAVQLMKFEGRGHAAGSVQRRGGRGALFSALGGREEGRRHIPKQPVQNAAGHKADDEPQLGRRENEKCGGRVTNTHFHMRALARHAITLTHSCKPSYLSSSPAQPVLQSTAAPGAAQNHRKPTPMTDNICTEMFTRCLRFFTPGELGFTSGFQTGIQLVYCRPSVRARAS